MLWHQPTNIRLVELPPYIYIHTLTIMYIIYIYIYVYGTKCTYVIYKRVRVCIYIYTYVRIYIYIYICVCLLCIEVHTYIYNYVYLLYPSVAPRFDRSPPVSVATSRQLPHPAEIDRASSRRSPSPAGNWPPGDHFTRKKCWENAGNMVISPSNNIDMGRL